jgi:ribosomal protein S18 acetylase RimI-like enzyme
MRVEPATLSDLPIIREVYEAARTKQRHLKSLTWPAFTEAAIIREIEIGALFCVRDNAGVAGVFSMLDQDPLIWGADERGEHLYLHRIARSDKHAGGGLVSAVLNWAFAECTRQKRAGLRLDTWACNDALIALYVSRGFRLIRTQLMPADPKLSAHYHGISLALLEAPV